MLALLFLLVFIGIAIAYLLTLSKALEAVRPQNRATEPSSVWLMLIPIFNLVWPFILYKKIATSLTAEYRSRGMSENADSTYVIGVIANCCMIISTILNISSNVSGTQQSMLASFFSLPGLIFWIIYWVQINNHKNRVKNLPGEQGKSQIFHS